MSKARTDRATCRGCKTRYDTSTLSPGTPFSCRHCGEVIYVPGQREQQGPEDPDRRFGEIAVKRGFTTQGLVDKALAEQDKPARTRRRVGAILMETGALSPRQVSEILRIQGARIAFLIPGYEIVEKLGEGGMGAVYKGVHLASGKTVAMKVLAQRLLMRPEFVERFHREARVAIDLDHPNIVKGFDEGAVGDQHYFVMEYVHGKSTSRVLKKRGRFGEKRAMDITRQVARALEYAHARGIVHRDIKPDNIMITRDGHVKLADYGLVKYLEDVEVAGLTTEGQVMGTPNYISPEQAKGKRELDIRSDLYSLGATLYHLTTGRQPFKGASSAVVMGMHVSSPLQDPREVNEELSKEAAGIIQTLMAKSPDNRYQTPRELLDELDNYFKARPTKSVRMRPSEEKDLAMTAWGAVSEVLSDDTDELDSIGEDARHLSRTAPILLGAGVLLLLIALLVPIILISESAETPEDVNTTENDEATELQEPSGVDAPGSTSSITFGGGEEPEETVNETELFASQMYKRALTESGKAQKNTLAEVIRLYPNTPAAELAARELAEVKRAEIAAEQQRKRQTQEAERRKRQAHEQKAKEAYEKLLLVKPTDPDRYRRELEGFVQTYGDTPEGRRAAEEIKAIDERLSQQRKDAEELKRLQEEEIRREKQRRRLAREGLAKIRFLEVYREALSTYHFDEAAKYARLLARDDRYPGLQPMGESCAADAEDLRLLLPAVQNAIESRGREEQALVFDPNHKLTGVVGSVREGIIHLLVGDNVLLKKPLTSLADDEMARLFREGYKQEDPPADLVLALFYLSRGNKKKARQLFNQVAKEDPRRKTHLELLRTE